MQSAKDETGQRRHITRRTFLKATGGVVVASWALGFTPARAQTAEVKIGVLYPLSGSLAATGKVLKAGVELATDFVNNSWPELKIPIGKWVGIPNLDGVKIDPIFVDHRSDPALGADLAKSLILDQKVVGLMGAYNSSVTKTASAMAERYGVPFINAASTSPALTERGYHWFWRTTPHDWFFTKDLFDFLDGLTQGKVKGVGAIPKNDIDNLASACENTEWGSHMSELIKEFAEKYKYNLVTSVLYSHQSPDLSSAVQTLLAKKPDSLLFASYISDALLFIRTLKEAKAAPKLLWGDDAGFVIPDFVTDLGTDTEGILTRTVFIAKLGKVKPVTEQINDIFKTRTGEDFSGASARSFTGLQTWAYVLNKAGSTDPKAIQEAANEIDIPGDALIMPWDGIKFDKTGQNTLGKGLIGQYQKEELEVAYPFDLATANMIYPFPGWK